MTYNFIKTNLENHVFTLTLARPEKRNAFTPTMVNEIDHALAAANCDTDVRAVVIRAEGPVFCAGMDLKAFNDPAADVLNPGIVNREISLGEVMAGLNKPSLALVEGNVIAGGFLVVAECTCVLARPEVEFSLPEVGLGIFPFQVMASLLKVMPQKRVLQRCLDPRPFPVPEAMEYGLVDGLLAEEKVAAILQGWVENAPLAVSKGFEALRKLEGGGDYGDLVAALKSLRGSEDAQEGIRALFERRRPEWKNR